jgi:hypothetical protein
MFRAFQKISRLMKLCFRLCLTLCFRLCFRPSQPIHSQISCSRAFSIQKFWCFTRLERSRDGGEIVFMSNRSDHKLSLKSLIVPTTNPCDLMFQLRTAYFDIFHTNGPISPSHPGDNVSGLRLLAQEFRLAVNTTASFATLRAGARSARDRETHLARPTSGTATQMESASTRTLTRQHRKTDCRPNTGQLHYGYLLEMGTGVPRDVAGAASAMNFRPSSLIVMRWPSPKKRTGHLGQAS